MREDFERAIASLDRKPKRECAKRLDRVNEVISFMRPGETARLVCPGFAPAALLVITDQRIIFLGNGDANLPLTDIQGARIHGEELMPYATSTLTVTLKSGVEYSFKLSGRNIAIDAYNALKPSLMK